MANSVFPQSLRVWWCLFLFTIVAIVAQATDSSESFFELTVLHTNDLHSRFDQVTSSGSKCSLRDREQNACYGGVSRLKYKVEETKRNEENTIFLNGGDFFQGSVWYSFLKWAVVANMTKQMGYTASSLGNHEFDDGVGDLVKFATEVTSSYPLLACNLNLINEPELAPLLQASVIKEFSGQKIGIIGYLTPETADLAQTGSVKFEDEVEAIQREVNSLRDKGVNILIAVGHSGYDVDLRIAEQVEDLDLVVGGHTNTFLWSGPMADAAVGGTPAGKYPTEVMQPSGRRVLVVQTNGYGLYLGHLKVSFDKNGEVTHWRGNPILMDKRIHQDPEIEEQVLHYRQLIESQMGNTVGVAEELIDGGRPKCRLEECDCGNFITDAMAAEMKVDIAVINSGAIKGSFDKGNITMADIYLAMPWSNTIDVVTIRGSTIREMLEHSVSDYDASHPDPRGWFLQISGLIVRYDIRRPVGQRIVSLHKGSPDDKDSWMPVEDSKTYEVALPSFLALGGDRFEMIPKQLTHHKNTGFLDKDLLISYLKKKNPLERPAAGRIVLITGLNSASGSSSLLNFGKNLFSFALALAPTLVALWRQLP